MTPGFLVTSRNPYFGDLHVHTTLSFDASAFGTTATARDAYRYAQGEPIQHPSGFEVQLAQPLDFYAVTDHGMLLGLINEAADTSSSFSTYSLSSPITTLMTVLMEAYLTWRTAVYFSQISLAMS